MKKTLLTALLWSSLALSAAAQTGTFYAVLTGAGENPAADPDGIGFGVVTLDAAAGTATFELIGINIANPTASHIHRGQPGQNGPVIIPFNAPFVNGTSSGVTTGVSASLINEILTNNPQNYYMNIHNADFPGGAIRGPLFAAPSTSAPVVLFEPIVAKVPGARGESFASDLRLINRSSAAGSATLDFFASNSAGLAGPTATRTVAVPSGAEVSINDLLGSTFSASSGIGALRITADKDVIAVSRLSNDRRASNGGTAGTLVATQRLSDTCRAGTLPLLSQASSLDQSNGLGFRTGIGYFAPSSLPVTATFTVRRADGTSVATKTVTIPGFSHAQFAVFDLVDTASPSDRVQDDFFVTFTATGGPLFVYSALVDNRTGDTSVQSAICSP
jgi:hypothetical protein